MIFDIAKAALSPEAVEEIQLFYLRRDTIVRDFRASGQPERRGLPAPEPVRRLSSQPKPWRVHSLPAGMRSRYTAGELARMPPHRRGG